MISGQIRRPRGTGQDTTATIRTPALRASRGVDYYGGVFVGAETIGALALEEPTHRGVRDVLTLLDPDDYSDYWRAFMDTGRQIAGAAWRYADILTVLSASARLLSPRNYLEIGVRRGRSLAVVAAAAPKAELIGIDMWVPAYAGMPNPGPDLVRGQLERVGFDGTAELLSGDSHRVLPRLFSERDDLAFDLITVDGDHTPSGARRDLLDVLPRLRVGGALVFDDIRHPGHPKLARVWRKVVRDRRYSTWAFDDVGYGVAVAVRRW